MTVLAERWKYLAETERILSGPPALARIERPEPRGNRVARFVLPLELCQPQNRKRAEPVWVGLKRRRSIAAAMWSHSRPWAKPLSGRPQVLCVRFSSNEPDKYSDWAKEAIDVLMAPTKRKPTGRLNIIVDDSPKHIELHQWWEFAKPKEGFVYIEVRT